MPFETAPAATGPRITPVTRGLWCWPALLPGAAVALDAVWPLRPGGGPLAPLWLDLAALVSLAWASLGPRRAKLADWATPMDGRIVAGLVLALLHVIARGGAREPMHWLHQIAASGVCFYALAARLRREARAPDAVWPAFAVMTLALTAWTLLQATAGSEGLAAASGDWDAAWASRAGVPKALLVLSLLCAGRAMEPGARPLWSVTALAGMVGVALHTLVGGLGLSLGALAGLDEPFYFGTMVVASLFLFGLARMAWFLARDRAAEASRWHAASAAYVVVVALLLLGGPTGGEGLRGVLALAGAATIAAHFAPRVSVTSGAAAPAPEPERREAA